MVGDIHGAQGNCLITANILGLDPRAEGLRLLGLFSTSAVFAVASTVSTG